jgi:LysR family transcriptional regulator, glycine cleavage system transcriptional activator
MSDLRRRLLPSNAALQSFIIAARHGSISAAAEEVGLTQSAVSRQISHLEDSLGISLFVRSGRCVALTEDGATYARAVAPALDLIRRATAEITIQKRDGEFNIATLPSFGMRWLAPRLPRLTQAHPEIVVNFAARSESFVITETDFDAVIHYGEADWHGMAHDRLFQEQTVPVCAPDLKTGYGIENAVDVMACPLLALTHRAAAWDDWFALHNLTNTAKLSGRFDQFLMLAQAAVAGGGVALIPRFLVEPELQAGTLVIPVDSALTDSFAYYLVYPHDRVSDPKFRLLRDWILAEASLMR